MAEASGSGSGGGGGPGPRSLRVKWGAEEVVLDAGALASVGALKRALQARTGVQPKRQKLMGVRPPRGRSLDEDDVPLAECKVGKKVMMVGSAEAVIEEVRVQAATVKEVPINDLADALVEADPTSVPESKDPINLEKLARRLERVTPKLLNPPRPGKKLLVSGTSGRRAGRSGGLTEGKVLDIDYTLFDHLTPAERPEELRRPFLHEFLEEAYQQFDIIIWSATNMKWVDLKMQELGVLNNDRFKIVCLLDSLSMINVHTEKYGVIKCKPLRFIWEHAVFKKEGQDEGHYDHRNTIMFDDVG